MLFNPSIDVKADHDIGVQKLVTNAITECDADLRHRLYSNIVLAGGSTMFPGMRTRLQVKSTNIAIDVHA